MDGAVMRMLSYLCVAALLAGCSDDAAESKPPKNVPDDPVPSAPAMNDPAFSVDQSRRWLVIGNDLDAGQDALTITVAAPSSVERIAVWLDDEAVAAATRDGSSFSADVDVSALAAGQHRFLLAADGAAKAFAAVDITRTHPMYVVMTVDWDYAETPDSELAWNESLHAQFPDVVITQLVGPYTFTEPTMPAGRATELSNWLIGMRDTHGDEIGLHIHPYCNFVEDAGVTCRHEPSVVGPDPDPNGYTVQCAAYTEAELTALFAHADTLFEQNGLGKPTSFRAGAWTANAAVLGALAANGYVADTSANNWQRLEEWMDPEPLPLWEWNAENWSEIGDLSQPYYPSRADVQTAGTPSIDILEVPDNGSLVDYVSEQEMIEIFEANWGGAELTEPKQLSIGYHNRTYPNYRSRIELTLAHLSATSIAADAGPVVFARLSDLAKVWPAP